MVRAIVETSIIIDLLRDFAPAVNWYAKQENPLLAVTPIVWMEAVGGGRTKDKRVKAARLLQRFHMVFPERGDMEWAMKAQMQYELSHGVGMMDCLIAAPCLRLQIPLYTRNMKHFRPLLSQLTQSPY